MKEGMQTCHTMGMAYSPLLFVSAYSPRARLPHFRTAARTLQSPCERQRLAGELARIR